MKIEQSFTVAAPRTHVWSLIRDPQTMMGCVPGCDSIEQLEGDIYKAGVSVPVGPIKAKFNLIVSVVEEVEPDLIRSETRGEEGSRASVVSSVNEVRLADAADGGTEIAYSADVSISGRLARYGQGMMKKIAGKLATRFEDSFRELAENRQEASGA